MKTSTRVFRAAFLALLCLAVVVGLVLVGSQVPKLIGEHIFRAGLHDLNGEGEWEDPVAFLVERASGNAKIAYAIYWRSGCSACVAQMKQVAALERYNDAVFVVAINAGGESDAAIRGYIAEHEIETSATLPFLGGVPAGQIDVFPYTVVAIRAPDGTWEEVGAQEGAQRAKDINLMSARLLAGALGRLEFWGGHLTVTDWYKWEGHHTLVAWYSGGYEPTGVEMAAMFKILIDIVALEPGGGLYVHVMVDHETYGPYIAFTSTTGYKAASAMTTPLDEEAAIEAVSGSWVMIDSDAYYSLTLAIPHLGAKDEQEALAWAYSGIAAGLAGHPWDDELTVASEAARGE